MTIYEITDGTCEEMKSLFYSLVPVVAEQAGVTEADAVFHMRRAWVDHLKDLKVTHAIDYRDDGRSAAWRVRLMLWRQGPQGQEELFADSDAGKAFNQHTVDAGATVIYGLPAVADWVLELCAQAHGASMLDGIDKGTLKNKLRSLRVSLSNSGGRSVWRIRYGVTAPPRVETDAPRSTNILRDLETRQAPSQRFIATVYVQREESPRHKSA